MPITPSPNSLTPERKIGFVLLLIFALLTVSLGILQIRNNLYAPFALNNQVPATLRDEVNSVEALRLRDTDRDGLTDFDEAYVYNTSRYIADTDSDGQTDGQEIAAGTNPLCEEGKQCAEQGEEAGGRADAATVGESLRALDPGPPPADLEGLLTNPAQVRQMLIDAGVDAALVARISDQDLLVMVNQVINATSTVAQLQALREAATTSPQR